MNIYLKELKMKHFINNLLIMLIT